jgi:hypothetical protein
LKRPSRPLPSIRLRLTLARSGSRRIIRRPLEKLRGIPPFEFENWAVIALGGIPNKVQVGDMGYFPIQVKQKDKAGRPDIDAFEAMMMREDCEKGFFVSFDYSSDALQEIESFFKRSHKVIVALTVQEILEEHIAKKLA